MQDIQNNDDHDAIMLQKEEFLSINNQCEVDFKTDILKHQKENANAKCHDELSDPDIHHDLTDIIRGHEKEIIPPPSRKYVHTIGKHNIVKNVGEKLHSCHRCSKTFTQAGSLKTHIMIHTVEKPHSCPQCNKRFTKRSAMKTHIMTHTGEKPHPCPHCRKSFSLAGVLKNHIMIHTGEKHHSCPQCSKTFSHHGNLKAMQCNAMQCNAMQCNAMQ